MINKNVCPNCGQLYDTDLEKCPLCGTAAQVVEPDAPVQRKRITEAERRQRRVDRKEAEQEARLRKKNDKIMQDAEEERLLKEASERRKEEKRLKKEAKRAAKQGREESGSEVPVSRPVISPAARAGAGGSPAPDRMTRRPSIEEQYVRDNSRVPRFFLVLSFMLLLFTLLVGGSYLLWKTDKVHIKLYDDLFAKHHETVDAADGNDVNPAESGSVETDAPYTGDPTAEAQPCQSLKLTEQEIVLDHVNQTKQIPVETVPNPTTDAKIFVSSDERVAKVSAAGVVTSVAPGTAVITVTCGSQSVECTVVCDFEADPNAEPSEVDVDELELNYKDKDMTFFHAGEFTTLTIVNIPSGTHVEWRSLDETIATIDENGRVVAVSDGTTKVIGTVGDKTVECWVRCHFPEENP